VHYEICVFVSNLVVFYVNS